MQQFLLLVNNMNLINKINLIPEISLLAIMVLTSPKISHAQEISGAFIMSSVGSIQNFANNSMAITFSSSSICFNVQNGASVIIGERGSGFFVNNCAVIERFNTLGIQLFPNPVTAITKIKFTNTPQLNDAFTISIWNMSGIKLATSQAFGYEIYQGKLLDISKLNTGTYILKIESDQYSETLKFITAK